MEVCTRNIAGREFLVIGTNMIPVDRIKSFDLNAPNGGCDNAVRIHTDDPSECLIWAYDNANALRDWILSRS